MKGNINPAPIILLLSLPLSILIIVSSFIGLFTPEFYYKETPNWQAQSVGQDIINLFLVTPFLLITSFLAFKKNKASEYLWAGSILYLIYTYIIYCFNIHFNSLFIVYCNILGLSFYSMMYFIYSNINAQPENKSSLAKIIGIYFISISVLFYFLWLSELIPSLINNKTPASLLETGLPTNPVHILDLAILLPGLLISGILLLRGKKIGYFVAPILLVFFILMDITIGFLAVIMKMRGIEGDLSITIIMSVLAVFSTVLLIFLLKRKPLI
jgi:hypothetical protein